MGCRWWWSKDFLRLLKSEVFFLESSDLIVDRLCRLPELVVGQWVEVAGVVCLPIGGVCRGYHLPEVEVDQ